MNANETPIKNTTSCSRSSEFICLRRSSGYSCPVTLHLPCKRGASDSTPCHRRFLLTYQCRIGACRQLSLELAKRQSYIAGSMAVGKQLSLSKKFRATSITLPRELLGRLDRIDSNRSALLERAAVAYLRDLARKERDRRDIAIIEKNAERLNREAADVLDYQKLW